MEKEYYNRTLTILKPDCIGKKVAGKVLSRLEEEEFEFITGKMCRLSKEQAEGFYDVHKDKPFFPDLVRFMTSGKVMILVLERENAIEKLREIIGATDPAEAKAGTIRKLYADSKQNNIIHASDSPENAVREISFFFSRDELM